MLSVGGGGVPGRRKKVDSKPVTSAVLMHFIILKLFLFRLSRFSIDFPLFCFSVRLRQVQPLPHISTPTRHFSSISPTRFCLKRIYFAYCLSLGVTSHGSIYKDSRNSSTFLPFQTVQRWKSGGQVL